MDRWAKLLCGREVVVGVRIDIYIYRSTLVYLAQTPAHQQQRSLLAAGPEAGDTGWRMVHVRQPINSTTFWVIKM